MVNIKIFIFLFEVVIGKITAFLSLSFYFNVKLFSNTAPAGTMTQPLIVGGMWTSNVIAICDITSS